MLLQDVLSGQFIALSALNNNFVEYDKCLSGLFTDASNLTQAVGEGQGIVIPQQDSSSSPEEEEQIENDIQDIKDKLGI